MLTCFIIALEHVVLRVHLCMHVNDLVYYINTYLTHVSCVHYLIARN